MYDKMDKQKADFLLDDLESYLSFRHLGPMLSNDHSSSKDHVTLKYDIPKWLKYDRSDKKLEDFSGSYAYKVEITPEKKKMFRDSIDRNNNIDLSLQLIYRDGITKKLWPVWTKSSE